MGAAVRSFAVSVVGALLSAGVLGGAVVLGSAGCEASCEDKRNCGPYDGLLLTTASSGVVGGGASSGGAGAGGAGVGGSAPLVFGTRLATGANHACGVTDSGTLRCWGDNSLGQLGHGSTAEQEPTPVAVALPDRTVEVAASNDSTCARLVSGEVWCWGRNPNGQLGDGSFSDSRVPVRVTGLKPTVSLVGGSTANFYALHTDATVSSWGLGRGLGTGSGSQDSAAPTPLALTNVAALFENSCAQRQDGSLWCWARVLAGDVPTEEQGASSVVDGANSSEHVCYASVTGQVYCRGENFCGRLGLGAVSQSAGFAQLSGASQVRTVDCSSVACLASGPNGTTYWGTLDSPKCEDDGMIESDVPIPAPFSQAADEVAVGSGFACVRSLSAGVFCWGNNRKGQLGNGDTEDSVAPVPVVGLGG